MNVSELTDGACLRVPLTLLVDAPWGNVRRGERNPKKYEELKASVAARGVVQSITVRPNGDNTALEVLAGYGRRDASGEVGREDIPVLVKLVDDKEGMAIGLAENLQREDLTIVDQVRIAQSYVSLYDADYDEAAKAVGWDVRVLKGRLKLNDCSGKVLDALEQGIILIGHAEVLCQFTETLQNNTLKKVIDEKWSIDFLKERANKATRVLRTAKFDTAECNTCPHNSDFQASLFDSHIGVGKCGNLPCFREKTDAWLARRKAELEQEEGTVLLAVEKPLTDRRTVGPDTVGAEPFNDDCLSCVSRIRVLQDGINKDAGDVTDNQCVNLSCFQAKVEALKAPEPTPSSGKATNKKKNGKTTARKNTKPVIAKSVIAQAEQYTRRVVGNALLERANYRQAMVLMGLCHLTGYKPKGERAYSAPDLVAVYAGWDHQKIEDEIAAAISHGTLTAEQGTGSFDGTKIVIRSSKHVDDVSALVTREWTPSKDWLSTYQKGAIESFCKHKGVGFAKAFDAAHENGSFDKLMKSKKDDVIKAILAFEFNWSNVAPKELIDLVGK